MSSHREAPEISQDPVADNTDVYAFVSPDDPTRSRSSPTTSRSRARPAGRTSSSSATTSSTRSTSTTTATRCRTSRTSSSSSTSVRNPNTFLYNTGPIGVARPTRTGTGGSSTTSRSPRTDRQGHTRRHDRARATNLASPAVQHRPALDAELRRLAKPPCTRCRSGETVFAGQRNDGFFVDLGLDLRPRRPAAVPEPPPDPDGARRRASTR